MCISWQSVNLWLRHDDLTVFNMAAVYHIGFSKFEMLTGVEGQHEPPHRNGSTTRHEIQQI